MRFIDEALISVTGGHGGPGSVSFRRETFIPRGGPDGGDGGAGADIYFIADEQLGTLQDFRYRRAYVAPAGLNGSGAHKAGKDGVDIEIRVPVGTIIKDAETSEIIIDMSEHGQTWLACEGGRGGKGNAHFTTSTFQTPKFAQPGEEGTTRTLKLELKLLADAAIIGFPNAGKSTLISVISAARPKVADYAFTTLTPNLGVVCLPDSHDGGNSFVVADIPGLIEGAHRGLGLGHKFLKHIERNRVLIHMLDGTQLLEEATRPDVSREENLSAAVEGMITRYRGIREELGLFNEALLHKPEIVVLNKVDVLESDPELLELAKKTLRERIMSIRGTHPLPEEPFLISGATRRGIDDLLKVLWAEIKQSREEAAKKSRRKTDADEATDSVPLPDDSGLRAR